MCVCGQSTQSATVQFHTIDYFLVLNESHRPLFSVLYSTPYCFCSALVRSVIKNFSLAFFFPVCLTALFFQHHRAAYDVIANCVVVEPIRRRR